MYADDVIMLKLETSKEEVKNKRRANTIQLKEKVKKGYMGMKGISVEN